MFNLAIHKIMTMTFYCFFFRDRGDSTENGQLNIIVFTPFIFIAIILPYGRAISSHLLCCERFAVKDHGFIPRVSHLR